jgi:hypothetical protein
MTRNRDRRERVARPIPGQQLAGPAPHVICTQARRSVARAGK